MNTSRIESLLEAILKVSQGGGGGAASDVNIISTTPQLAEETTVQGLATQLTSVIAQLTNINGNTISNLPFNADYIEETNPDANGNYQTITYKQGGSGGTIVKTITITYDSNGGILTYLEA